MAIWSAPAAAVRREQLALDQEGERQRLGRGARRTELLLVLGLGLLQGLLFWALMPPWQHYDEPTHFEYAQLLALRGYVRPPFDWEPAWRAEIADSMFRFRFDPPGVRRDIVNPIEPDIGISELNHPRAYYTLAALPIMLLEAHPVETQLYGARLTSLGLYLLTILCAYRVGGLLFPERAALRLALPLLLTLSPTFGDIMTAVNNDALANFTGAAFFLGCVLLIRDGPRPQALALALLGIGAALLAKRSTIVLLPLLPLALYWSLARRPLRWWIYGAAAAGALLLLLLVVFQPPSWQALTGAPAEPPPGEGVYSTQSLPPQPALSVRPWVETGVQRLLRESPSNMLALALDWERTQTLYPAALRNLLFSSTMHLGWNHVHLPAAWRGLLAGGLGFVVLGLGALGLRRQLGQLSAPAAWSARVDWLALWGVLVALAVALSYLFAPPQLSSQYFPNGRYLFVMLLPMLLLVLRGVEGWLPARWVGWGALGAVALFGALNLSALVAVLRFYYL